MSCATSSDCPAGTPEARAASVCATSSCTECETDTDCPADRPACARVMGAMVIPFNTCVACTRDAHCPSEKPHCVSTGGVGGECRSCASNADCEVGNCSAAGCVPGCSDDSECTNPLTHCAHQRCEVITCSDSSVCPAHAECRDGTCQRSPCELDSDCTDAVCVNGVCYETLGYCFTQTIGQ